MNLKELQLQGGATFTQTKRQMKASKGYMVSLEDYEKVVSSDNTQEIKEELDNAINLVQLLKENKDNAIKGVVDMYAGIWFNGDKAYIDVSVRVLNKNRAIQLGKEFKQLAIYDIENNKVVEL